jgi:hypothetical protein
MLKKLMVLFATAVLIGACSSEPPPPPPPPPQPAAPPSFMVFFDWDSIKLSDASLNVLSQAVTAFRSMQGARITATGHTDTSGSPQYNMALSLRRANTVKAELVRQGVPAAAISTVGVGEEGLLVQTGDGVREPQNRRVEIVVQGQVAAAPAAMPMNDQAYCMALVNAFNQGAGPRGSLQPSNATAVAINQCQAGNPGPAIPVLEQSLRDARVPLPPRG